MDMLCNKCSEPWGWFYIRDEILEEQTLYEKMQKHGGYVTEVGTGVTDTGYMEITKADKANGYIADPNLSWQFNPGPTIAQCPACIGKDIEPSDNAKIRAELAHLYGDDIDGFMADMEDFGLE